MMASARESWERSAIATAAKAANSSEISRSVMRMVWSCQRARLQSVFLIYRVPEREQCARKAREEAEGEQFETVELHVGGVESRSMCKWREHEVGGSFL